MATTPADSAPTDEPEGQSSEFDDAFEAFASGNEPPPADAAEGDADPNPDGDDDSQQPAPEGVRENTDAAPAPAAPAQPASDDIDWSQYPENVRKTFERMQQENRSLRGRQSTLDRQLHEFRTRQPQTPAPSPAGNDDKPAPKVDDEKLKALREDYPEFAPALDELVSLRTTVANMAGSVQQVEGERTTAYLRGQVNSLAEQMPDWETWGGDKRFESWITTQPRHIQEAAARNSEFVVDAAEAFDVLSRFKAAHEAPAPNLKPDPKRERQLGASRDATTKQPATVSGVPDDFGAAFDHHAKQIEKGRTR